MNLDEFIQLEEDWIDKMTEDERAKIYSKDQRK